MATSKVVAGVRLDPEFRSLVDDIVEAYEMEYKAFRKKKYGVDASFEDHQKTVATAKAIAGLDHLLRGSHQDYLERAKEEGFPVSSLQQFADEFEAYMMREKREDVDDMEEYFEWFNDGWVIELARQELAKGSFVGLDSALSVAHVHESVLSVLAQEHARETGQNADPTEFRDTFYSLLDELKEGAYVDRWDAELRKEGVPTSRHERSWTVDANLGSRRSEVRVRGHRRRTGW